VETIIWAAPRTDIKELAEIRMQFVNKYGKDFAMASMENKSERVNARVIHKLSVLTPEPMLVNEYLREIAKAHNIDFDPSDSMHSTVVDLYGKNGGNDAHRDLIDVLDGIPNQHPGPLPAPLPLDLYYQPPQYSPPPGAQRHDGIPADQYEQFLQWQRSCASPGAPPQYVTAPPVPGYGSGGAPEMQRPAGAGGSPFLAPGLPPGPPAVAPPPKAVWSAPGGAVGAAPPPVASAPTFGTSAPAFSPPPAGMPAFHNSASAGPAWQSGGDADDDIGLPSAPTGALGDGNGGDGDGDDVPDFDELAARFAALKAKK